jgi:hypothetical protein
MLADRASEMGYGGADRAVYVRVPYLPDRQVLQDFQTRPHPQARMDDLLASPSIRGLRGIDLALCFRIRTDRNA